MKQHTKSTIEEIRERFDNDVERFSNLETGQVSTIDAKISLDLITEAANRIVPNATKLLDIGCGAGNYSLKMLTRNPRLDITLVDLSRPMLDRAVARITEESAHAESIQGDIRQIDLPENTFDIALAGAVFHHLRDDEDWEHTFSKVFKSLKVGGCLMISDLIVQNTPAVTEYTWEKYKEYLENVGGKEYRQKVMAYIDREDSPRSLNFQLKLMEKIGFRDTEILHKNMCFAAFGGIK